ncbi:hypothetical protein Trydic_g23043 [Trypoxylus dichotomus]
MTSYEAWTGKKPSLDHIRTFGSEAFVHIPKEKRRKLDKKSVNLILTGYDGNSTNYRLFDPITKQVVISRETFSEGNSVSVFNNHEPIVVDNTYFEEAEEPNQFSEEEQMKDNASEDDVTHTEDIGKINLRPRHLIKRRTRYEANLADVEIPETFKQAMESDDSSRWKDAIEEELEALKSNETWEVVPLPNSQNRQSNRNGYLPLKNHQEAKYQDTKSGCALKAMDRGAV